jgi:inner membrane protein
MDNLCHSLAGAAIAQAGFARRLPRATLLAIVAANIADVDAFTYLVGDSATAVAFRRGWTHGLPALVVWSVALAALFAWWNRKRPLLAAVADADAPAGRSVSFAAFFPLAAIAVVSHPLLDWLNTYGVRFLMPFSDEWFYGDALFIVDPPLLVLLGAGAWLASQALRAGSARSELPARAALVVALLYITAMKAMSEDTRRAAERQFAMPNATRGDLMVSPVPLSFTRRNVLVRTLRDYDRFPAEWRMRGVVVGPLASRDPIGATPALVAAVRATPAGERFLRWSRFPYFVPGSGPDTGTVFVGDTRYAAGTVESWAGIRVRPPTLGAGGTH